MMRQLPTITERNQARDFESEHKWVHMLIERQRDSNTRDIGTIAVIQRWLDDIYVKQWQAAKEQEAAISYGAVYIDMPPAR